MSTVYQTIRQVVEELIEALTDRDDYALAVAADYCDVLCPVQTAEELEEELQRIRDEELMGIYSSFSDYVDEQQEAILYDASDDLARYFDRSQFSYDLEITTNFYDGDACYIFYS